MRLAVLLSPFLALAISAGQELASPSPAPSATPAATPNATPVATPAPTPVARRISLRFALPPLEGTISLGIYDQNGRLVRVLHREDDISDFTAGHDALETTWDGTDNRGQPLPDGKYHARGFVVGDLEVEGVAYFFNDWVTDEKSPHVQRLSQLWMKDGELRVDLELAGGRKTAFVCDQESGALLNEVSPNEGEHCPQATPPPNIVHALDCAPGRDSTIWYVDLVDETGAREVKQLAREHEVLRRLDYEGDDPRPERIEASPVAEKIFLIEQSEILQRLRSLALVRTTSDSTEGAVSDWKSVFDRKIMAHQSFSLEKGKAVASATEPSAQPTSIGQKLQPNPLQKNRSDKVDLAVGMDADGSFLQTSDGLPLRTISETPHLLRVVLDRTGEQTIDVFQDDGAVVEQFRISHLAQMNAFDCGDFELK